MAQLVNCPTFHLSSGHDLTLHEFEPRVRLWAVSADPISSSSPRFCLGFCLFLSLLLPCSCFCMHSLSLSLKIHILKKNRPWLEWVLHLLVLQNCLDCSQLSPSVWVSVWLITFDQKRSLGLWPGSAPIWINWNLAATESCHHVPGVSLVYLGLLCPAVKLHSFLHKDCLSFFFLLFILK